MKLEKYSAIFSWTTVMACDFSSFPSCEKTFFFFFFAALNWNLSPENPWYKLPLSLWTSSKDSIHNLQKQIFPDFVMECLSSEYEFAILSLHCQVLKTKYYPNEEYRWVLSSVEKDQARSLIFKRQFFANVLHAYSKSLLSGLYELMESQCSSSSSHWGESYFLCWLTQGVFCCPSISLCYVLAFREAEFHYSQNPV